MIAINRRPTRISSFPPEHVLPFSEGGLFELGRHGLFVQYSALELLCFGGQDVAYQLEKFAALSAHFSFLKGTQSFVP